MLCTVNEHLYQTVLDVTMTQYNGNNGVQANTPPVDFASRLNTRLTIHQTSPCLSPHEDLHHEDQLLHGNRVQKPDHLAHGLRREPARIHLPPSTADDTLRQPRTALHPPRSLGSSPVDLSVATCQDCVRTSGSSKV